MDALCANQSGGPAIWWASHEIPGLVTLEDFRWLLGRAADDAVSLDRRQRYLVLAQALPWHSDHGCVEVWIEYRHVEPISSRFRFPLSVDLDSELARDLRNELAARKHANRPKQRKGVEPPPRERVEAALRDAETIDPCYFFNVCYELTLEEYSERYGDERFLVRTPGWQAADDVTRRRIVATARKLLATNSDEPESESGQPLNAVRMGYMHAFWLALDQDPEWVEVLPQEWWDRWGPYLLRQLHAGMPKEPQDQVRATVQMIHRKAAAARNALLAVARSVQEGAAHTCRSLFEVFEVIPDAVLDAQLCELLREGAVPGDRVGTVAEFVLGRDGARGQAACLVALATPRSPASDSAAVQAAVALLSERASESWDRVAAFLRGRNDLAGPVLAQFSHGQRFHLGGRRHQQTFASLPPSRVGEMIALLLELFPPDMDPARDGGLVTPDDSAREVRDGLISSLGGQVSADAVLALRKLDHEFGTKYPFLRRPRATAERAYRLSLWAPIPPSSVADLLASNSKRLIRSETDAIDGVLEALDAYNRGLRSRSPSDLEDLWNLPSCTPPTPRPEERVSDKICSAIRDYFRQYAVTADREVQISRRLQQKKHAGAAGSEVDVLVSIPASGSMKDDRIVLPIEVKLSCNRKEAKNGMKDQLVARYMQQIGASCGVYVLAWMEAPNLQKTHRPAWRNVDAATTELNAQAAEISTESGGAFSVSVFVLDASLLAGSPAKSHNVRPRRKGNIPAIKGAKQQQGRSKRPAKGKAQRRAPGAASGTFHPKKPKRG